MNVERSQKSKGRKWERQRQRKMNANVNKVKTAVCVPFVETKVMKFSDYLTQIIFIVNKTNFTPDYYHHECMRLDHQCIHSNLDLIRICCRFRWLSKCWMTNTFSNRFSTSSRRFKQVKYAAVQLPQHALTIVFKTCMKIKREERRSSASLWDDGDGGWWSRSGVRWYLLSFISVHIRKYCVCVCERVRVCELSWIESIFYAHAGRHVWSCALLFGPQYLFFFSIIYPIVFFLFFLFQVFHLCHFWLHF